MDAISGRRTNGMTRKTVFIFCIWALLTPASPPSYKLGKEKKDRDFHVKSLKTPPEVVARVCLKQILKP